MLQAIVNNARMVELWDVIDILLVAFLFYKVMRFLCNTNAQKLFQVGTGYGDALGILFLDTKLDTLLLHLLCPLGLTNSRKEDCQGNQHQRRDHAVINGVIHHRILFS